MALALAVASWRKIWGPQDDGKKRKNASRDCDRHEEALAGLRGEIGTIREKISALEARAESTDRNDSEQWGAIRRIESETHAALGQLGNVLARLEGLLEGMSR